LYAGYFVANGVDPWGLCSDYGAWDGIKDFVRGFGQGAIDTANGAKNALLDSPDIVRQGLNAGNYYGNRLYGNSSNPMEGSIEGTWGLQTDGFRNLGNNAIANTDDTRWVSQIAGAVATLPIGGVRGSATRGTANPTKSGAPGRNFWSGGDIAREAAEANALQTGRTTLELSNPGLKAQSDAMLEAGKDWVTQVRPTVWEPASKSFAEGAHGVVDVFQNSQGVGVGSVWRKIEYPVLTQPGNGVTIRYNVVMPDGTIFRP
jgi:hypothetical protein